MSTTRNIHRTVGQPLRAARTGVFAVVVLLAMVGTASASELMGNRATGIVQGTITQEATEGSENVLNVGSIFVEPEDTAREIEVYAAVEGDILLQTKGSHTVVNIGSYRGR